VGSRRDCLSGDQKTSLCAGACAAGGECCSLAPRSLPCLGANLAPLFSCHSWRQARLAGGAGSGTVAPCLANRTESVPWWRVRRQRPLCVQAARCSRVNAPPPQGINER
jgi:hypothetical protein